MILDNLNNSNKYTALHPLFKKAFHYLKSFDPLKIDEGKHDIEGDKLFALVSKHEDYKLNTILEAHKRYIDIQFLYSGTDIIGWKELEKCMQLQVAFDKTKDVVLYKDKPDFAFKLNAGCFTILYPEDAHSPLMGSENLIKVVLKVELEHK